MDSYGEIWWNHVPTAMQLVNDVKEALQNWKSTAVSSGSEEWSCSFFDAVSAQIREENFSVAFYTLDLDSLAESSTITDGIADQLGIGYMITRNIANLLPELPDGGSIWILQHMNAKRQQELEKLLKHVSSCHAPISFLFVQEGQGKPKGCFKAELLPNKLDLQYYAWTLLLGKLPNHLLEYASQLAVELSSQKPARCAEICSNIEDILRNP